MYTNLWLLYNTTICLTQPISWVFLQEMQFSSDVKSGFRSLEQPWSCLWVGWDLCHQTTEHWFIFINFTPEQHYSNSLITYWFRTHNSNPADWHNFHLTRLYFVFLSLFQSFQKQGHIKPLSSELLDVGSAIVSAREKSWPCTLMTNLSQRTAKTAGLVYLAEIK